MFVSRFLAFASFFLGAWSASLQQVNSYGSNPAGVPMYIYVPDNLPSNPALVLAIHYCSGTAQAYYSGTAWARNADTHGFIVIYPSSPHSGTCWDVSSRATLTRNGGGDSNSIANMVRYAINTYGVDTDRVFVTGSSSGAMMTNIMAAAYPELFAAGSLYSGVAAGCFMSSANLVDAWNSTCANGRVVASQSYWASVVDGMGGSPPYPRMQIWHGSADNLIYPQNYNETIKQWTGVFGVSQTPTNTRANSAAGSPQAGYYTYDYGSNVQGIYGVGVGHGVPEHVQQSMEWFGIA